jgi:FkbM family methyltransferase
MGLIQRLITIIPAPENRVELGRLTRSGTPAQGEPMIQIKHWPARSCARFLRTFRCEPLRWRLAPLTVAHVRKHGRAMGRRIVRTAYGYRMELHLHDWVDQHIYATGSYEDDTGRVIAALVGPGDCAIDLGANIGYFTLLLARRVGPAGRVIAFEPAPATRLRLRRNLQLNAVANVEVREEAISDHDGQAVFAGGPPEHSGIASLRPGAPSEQSYSVQTAPDRNVPAAAGVAAADQDRHRGGRVPRPPGHAAAPGALPARHRHRGQQRLPQGYGQLGRSGPGVPHLTGLSPVSDRLGWLGCDRAVEPKAAGPIQHALHPPHGAAAWADCAPPLRLHAVSHLEVMDFATRVETQVADLPDQAFFQTFAPDGLLYILDYGNSRMLKLDPAISFAQAGEFALNPGVTTVNEQFPIGPTGNLFLSDGLGGGSTYSAAGDYLTSLAPPERLVTDNPYKGLSYLSAEFDGHVYAFNTPGGYIYQYFDTSVVPEPSTLALLLGPLAAAVYRPRKGNASGGGKSSGV